MLKCRLGRRCQCWGRSIVCLIVFSWQRPITRYLLQTVAKWMRQQKNMCPQMGLKCFPWSRMSWIAALLTL